MWIIIKFVLALGAFCFRLAGKSFARTGATEGELNGNPYFIQSKQSKYRTTSTNIGIQFKCSTVFKITKEGSWDRLFKNLSIVEEVQTGDDKFDAKIYIACDAPSFKVAFKNIPQIRELILELFKNGCQQIFCDGSTLWCKFPGDQQSNSTLLKMCVDLKVAFFEVDKSKSKMRRDPFAFKVVIIESIIYSLAAYSWSGVMEWQFFREDVHLSPFLVMGFGVGVGVLFTLVFIFAVIVTLRKSSKAHRVILESSIVLGLSIPLGGIQVVSDLNTNLDRSTPISIEAKVERVYKQMHRGRRGRRYYTYHLDIEPSTVPADFEISRHIEISSAKFNELSNAKNVVLSIGKGYLKYPWYKNIEAR